MIWPGVLGMAAKMKSTTDILKIYLYIYIYAKCEIYIF